MQEDRTAKWQRAIQASTAGLLTRDEARKEMGLDAIDNAHVFTTWQPSPIEAAETDEPEPDEANEELASLERKRFTDFARKRQKEGNEDKIASFKFRYLSKAEQVQLLKGYAETELAKELKRANDLMEARK